MQWPRLRPSGRAIASLVATGLFLTATSVPPLHDPMWGEETTWSPVGAGYGLLYLVAAMLIARRTRSGFGLGFVLGMFGLSLTLGLMVAWLGRQSWDVGWPVETLVIGLLAAAHALIVVGVLGGARQQRVLGELDRRRRAAAALLAGLGFALTFGLAAGEFSITLTPIMMPGLYQALEFWLGIPQFAAFAAITLGARFASVGSVVVSAAGVLLSVVVIAALLDHGTSPMGSIVLWTMMASAWAAAGLLLVVPAWTGTRAGTSRLSPAQK